MAETVLQNALASDAPTEIRDAGRLNPLAELWVPPVFTLIWLAILVGGIVAFFILRRRLGWRAAVAGYAGSLLIAPLAIVTPHEPWAHPSFWIEVYGYLICGAVIPSAPILVVGVVVGHFVARSRCTKT